MVDQLRTFAREVIRVAREVGTDGQLGGQARVPGVAGTWKDLTDSVNLMASNLTDQVRGICRRWFEYTGLSAELTAASCRTALHPDDLSRSWAMWQDAQRTGEPARETPHRARCRPRDSDRIDEPHDARSPRSMRADWK